MIRALWALAFGAMVITLLASSCSAPFPLKPNPIAPGVTHEPGFSAFCRDHPHRATCP